jgi:hypothetical protein
MAAVLDASWPCGVDSPGFRLPPNAAFISAEIPANTSDSAGNTSPVDVNSTFGTLLVAVMLPIL